MRDEAPADCARDDRAWMLAATILAYSMAFIRTYVLRIILLALPGREMARHAG
ncbi:MAG: hypothetical protein KTR21_10430 [Rhodobacteraceae bacterium]|nr:hypothetical protein [Paracoccaceae bacterium]